MIGEEQDKKPGKMIPKQYAPHPFAKTIYFLVTDRAVWSVAVEYILRSVETRAAVIRAFLSSLPPSMGHLRFCAERVYWFSVYRYVSSDVHQLILAA